MMIFIIQQIRYIYRQFVFFGGLLQKDLDSLVQCWNTHRIRLPEETQFPVFQMSSIFSGGNWRTGYITSSESRRYRNGGVFIRLYK